MEFVFIKDAVNVDNHNRRGVYSDIVRNWLGTDNKTLKMMCKNDEEKKRVSCALYAFRRGNKLDFTIFNERGTNNVYCVKA